LGKKKGKKGGRKAAVFFGDSVDLGKRGRKKEDQPGIAGKKKKGEEV